MKAIDGDDRESWNGEGHKVCVAREKRRKRKRGREKVYDTTHTIDEGSLDRSSNFTTASAILVAMLCS